MFVILCLVHLAIGAASGACVIEQLPAGVLMPFESMIGQPMSFNPADPACALFRVDADLKKIGDPVVQLSALRCVGGTNPAAPINAVLYCYTTDQAQIDLINAACVAADGQHCKLFGGAGSNTVVKRPDVFFSGVDPPTGITTQIQRTTTATFAQFLADKQLCAQAIVYRTGATGCWPAPADTNPQFIFGQTMGLPPGQTAAESAILPGLRPVPGFPSVLFPRGFPSQCQPAGDVGNGKGKGKGSGSA